MIYIKTAEGWLYLAVLIDLYSRRLVGGHIDDHMESELSLNALKIALNLRKYKSGLIHHTDQGPQYCSHIYPIVLPLFKEVSDCTDLVNT